MLYSKTVLEHLENPRNQGEMPDAHTSREVVNSACGDRVVLFIKCSDQKITAALMKAYGCPPTIAVASFLTEWLRDKTIREALTLEADKLIALLDGLPRGKRHAADLAIEALHKTLSSILK